MLKIASFSGKMNVLNEINKVVPGHPYHVSTHYQTTYDEDHQQMTSEKMAVSGRESVCVCVCACCVCVCLCVVVLSEQ